MTAEEVRRWMKVHAGDRIVRVEDVWIPQDVRRLTVRAQRLLDLIDTAEADIRALVRRLMHGPGPARQTSGH